MRPSVNTFPSADRKVRVDSTCTKKIKRVGLLSPYICVVALNSLSGVGGF